MGYTPNNIQVYLYATAGCLAGLGSGGRYLTDPIPSDYLSYGAAADAFAQEVDTLWGSNPSNILELLTLQAAATETWSNRSPLSSDHALIPGSYRQIAAGIIALIQQGTIQVGSEGINPAGGFTPIPSLLWVDPQNRTGLASDGNDGFTASTPLRSWNGGVLPILDGNGRVLLTHSIRFNFMSSSPSDGTDPIVFEPTIADFSSVRFNGTFDAHNLVASGALANVTAKNRALGHTLSVDLSSTPAAAVGMVLINTTAGKSSICILRKDLGGGVFALTQPMTIIANWPTDGDPQSVDTFANGDTYSLYNEDMIDLARLDPTATEFAPPNADQFTVVTNLGVLNPSTFVNPCYLADTVVFLYPNLQRRVNYLRPSFSRNSIMFGGFGPNGIQGGVTSIQGTGSKLWLLGGAYAVIRCNGVYADQDVVFTSAGSQISAGTLGAVATDVGTVIDIASEVALTDSGFGAALYGPGAMNVFFGRLTIQGVSAVASLLLSGGIAINGQSAGFTATRANPSVVNGNVAITPANIDANASGLFVPGGGAIATFG